MTSNGKDTLPERSPVLGNDALSLLVRVLSAIVEWAGRLTMVMLFAMVLLIATNVILRYLVGIGPVWLQEMEWHLLVPVAMFACAHGLRHRSHVHVDIFFEKLDPRGRTLIDLFASVLTLATWAFVLWLSTDFVVSSYEIGEGSPDPGGLDNRFIIKAAVPIGAALLVMQGIVEVILDLKHLARS